MLRTFERNVTKFESIKAENIIMSGQNHDISQFSSGDVAFSNPKDSQLRQTVTLGSVRLHDANTGNMNLIPQPSEDPKDPLRWLVPSHLVHRRS
jgi:hypothetical protein